MELKSGQTRQLTSVESLDPRSLALSPDGSLVYFFDGKLLRRTALSSLRDRDLYRIPEAAGRAEGFSLSDDGRYAFLTETEGGRSRIRMIATATGTATTVLETGDPISMPMPNPRRASLLYRLADRELWLINYDGAQNRRLRTAPGTMGPVLWTSSGRTVLYLNIPEDRAKLNNIRELTPDTNTDQLIGPTSQFAAFSRNSDASVFVGASANKASPHVLLLLRVSRREFTLCEHRAGDARLVGPIFAPNSQRVFFQSDMHGKPALYSVAVERFVERTETE
jgi:oligogalacturonide lyase